MHGVEVHAYGPTMLHAKIVLVDGTWSLVRSFNFDLFSLKLNLENGCSAPASRLAFAAMPQISKVVPSSNIGLSVTKVSSKSPTSRP